MNNLFIGLSLEEVTSEFSKKLDTLEQSNSTTDHLLLDLNKRFTLEYEILSKKLQGLSHYQSLTPGQRERYLFSLIQARLRGVQESEFVAASLTVGLSERIQPQKNDRYKVSFIQALGFQNHFKLTFIHT